MGVGLHPSRLTQWRFSKLAVRTGKPNFAEQYWVDKAVEKAAFVLEKRFATAQELLKDLKGSIGSN
jgi:hypothetical protein